MPWQEIRYISGAAYMSTNYDGRYKLRLQGTCNEHNMRYLQVLLTESALAPDSVQLGHIEIKALVE